MSIFKSTFPQGVKEQLEARQNKTLSRDSEAIRYLNSRTAWIRMTSAVNVDKKNTLSQDNVLLGGALYNKAPRSGVGSTGEKAYSTKTPSGVNHRLGMKPMPGITGIDIKSKGGYGSLKEVTVKFNCWDIRQLEELELLYMRPGYSVLVEWGWIPYLDNSGKLSTIVDLTNDVLTGGKTKEEIWKSIHEKSTKNGNYDAIYGFIKNYSWNARDDGGYDCTTDIMTMGEIIESLKINYAATDKLIATPEVKGLFKTLDGSQFETNASVSKSYAQNYLAGIMNELWAIAKEKVTDSPIGAKGISLDGHMYNFLRYDITIARKDPAATKDSFVEEDQQIYLPLKDIVHILNKYILLSDQKAKTPIAAVSTTEGAHNGGKEGDPLLCLGNKFQLSTDPTICQIKNDAWKDLASLGLDKIAKINGTNTETLSKLMDTMSENFLDEPNGKQLGIIGNIYVNLGYIYSLVVNDELASQDKKEKKDINLYDFLKNMLSGISGCIGNVATLDIFVDPVDSVARIIDLNYVEREGRDKIYKDAFTLEIANLKSTVRSYKLESQMSPDQMTIIAIGAQVKGGALASDNNTLLDFNRGLLDRIIKTKTEPSPTKDKKAAEEDKKTKLEALKTNVSVILSYINTADPSWYEHAGDFDVANSGKYANALKDIINSYKSFIKDDNKNRSIIPTKLSLEMDGIGGIVIGNIFKIPDDLLPKGYKGVEFGSKIGFVVTEIGASIQDNDWVSKIGARFVILDEPKGKDDSALWSKITAEAIKVAVIVLPKPPVVAVAANIEDEFNILLGGGGSNKPGKVTASLRTFNEVCTSVIANIEGGYYHPRMLLPNSRGKVRLVDRSGIMRAIDPKTGGKMDGMSPSGETMYGVDRLNGLDNRANNPAVWDLFWKLIADNGGPDLWDYNHIPPNPLKSQLQALTVKIIEPQFESLMKRKVKDKKIQDVIRSDGRLYFNFVYATWNGQSFFERYANAVEKAYNAGTTDPLQLANLVVRLRQGSTSKTIRDGGNIIAGLIGLS
jgi:hypothetical protein